MEEKNEANKTNSKRVVDTLKPFTEKEKDLISEVVSVVWFFFGKPQGHKISDYFMPVQLAFQLFRIRAPKKRVQLFKELMEMENELAKAFNQTRETQDENG